MSRETGPFARRIGSRVAAAAPTVRRPMIWGLRLLPTVFVFPMVVTLMSGRPVKLLGLLAGTALLVLAGMLVRRGLDATADYEVQRFAPAPPPFRLLGAAALGTGFFVISQLATGYGVTMGLLLGALGAGAAVVTYGLDPTSAKRLDPATAARTGVRTEQVIAAIKEAEAKLEDIRSHAALLANKDLKRRIDRILERAHAVLDELETDPKDLPRARRFLNTYLDGTRNVIRAYTKRQQDFAETALAANFTNVLGTIETVFEEQLEHLKKDEALDLEVAIEVLHTQLTKEGVG
ncbi:MAG: 5-bromo-4-chloroindolyl phosphate hydrolysis family protein [Pseudomonadota bacterium]